MQINNSYQNEIKENFKHFNYGFAILKFLLSFLVLLAHCFNPKSTKNKIIINFARNRKFHVPCFFILSFYFMLKNLVTKNKKVISDRFLRLFIPYIGWALIIWITNNLMNIKNKYMFGCGFKDLKHQIIWANSYLSHFWFLWNLIVITLLFVVIIYIFNNHYLFIMQILLLFSYIAQYSGYHINNFIVNNPYFDRVTIAVLFESIPYAITGANLRYYKIIEFLQKHKIKTLIFSILIYNIIIEYRIFRYIKGINFQGINLNIISLCIIFIFSLFPSDKIKHYIISKFIMEITKYSAGVYYLHVPIRDYLKYYFNFIKRGLFIGNISIFVICNTKLIVIIMN